MPESSAKLLSLFERAILGNLRHSGLSPEVRPLSGVGNFPSGPVVTLAAAVGLRSPELTGTLRFEFPNATSIFPPEAVTSNEERALEQWLDQTLRIASGLLQAEGVRLDFALPNILSGNSLDTLGTAEEMPRMGLEFRTSGGSFRVYLDLHVAAPESRSPEQPSHSPRHWSPEALLEFVRAVRKTMEVQFSTRIEIGAPFKKSSKNFTFDVGSMIGVTEGDFSGYFGMFYEKSAFLGLMGALLGERFTELTSEIEDGASEITNICFGVAKRVLNEQWHSIQMALPYLVRGDKISSAPSSPDRIAISVPLITPQGKFWIEFGYRSS